MSTIFVTPPLGKVRENFTWENGSDEATSIIIFLLIFLVLFLVSSPLTVLKLSTTAKDTIQTQCLLVSYAIFFSISQHQSIIKLMFYFFFFW